MLEVNYGPNCLPHQFSLTEIDSCTFTLSSKDDIATLIKILTKWMQENFLLSQSDYNDLILSRIPTLNTLDGDLAYLKQIIAQKKLMSTIKSEIDVHLRSQIPTDLDPSNESWITALQLQSLEKSITNPDPAQPKKSYDSDLQKLEDSY